jgi:hypothetical protein
MHNFIVFSFFSQVFDERGTYDQQLTCRVEIHIDDPHLLPLHVELIWT